MVCFQDDLLASGKTPREMRSNLKAVLKRLSDFGLKVNKKKCKFFQDSVQYLGHRIDKEGLHMCNDKVKAVVQAPVPQDIKHLRAWLGLVNYYGKFLPNLSTVLAPLHELLRKDCKWRWTEQCNNSFVEIKNLIASSRVITHYDPSLPIKLACDASPYGVGAVISHVFPGGVEKPIAFASRTLS